MCLVRPATLSARDLLPSPVPYPFPAPLHDIAADSTCMACMLSTRATSTEISGVSCWVYRGEGYDIDIQQREKVRGMRHLIYPVSKHPSSLARC